MRLKIEDRSDGFKKLRSNNKKVFEKVNDKGPKKIRATKKWGWGERFASTPFRSSPSIFSKPSFLFFFSSPKMKKSSTCWRLLFCFVSYLNGDGEGYGRSIYPGKNQFVSMTHFTNLNWIFAWLSSLEAIFQSCYRQHVKHVKRRKNNSKLLQFYVNNSKKWRRFRFKILFSGTHFRIQA